MFNYKLLKLGMTRDEVVKLCGEPNQKSLGTRKYPTPAIYKYGDIELHFERWKFGELWMVFYEPTHTTLLK